MQPRTAFHNEKTFLYLTDTQEIPADKLIKLDGYAFDVDELVENAQQNLIKFYQNPHVTSVTDNNRFSPAAIDLLRTHSMLSQYAQSLDEMLAAQAAKISKETVDAVLVFLQEIEQPNVVDNETSRAKFYEYYLTLNDDDKENLNAYVISMHLVGGGVQALKFDAALAGGSEASQCIIITRLYLWQFVIDFRPAEITKIPASTISMMNRAHLKIQPRATYNLPTLPVSGSVDNLNTVNLVRGLITGGEFTVQYVSDEEEQEELAQPRGLFHRQRFFKRPEDDKWEATLGVMIVTPDSISFRDADHGNIHSILDILVPNRSFDFGLWTVANELRSILSMGERLTDGLDRVEEIRRAFRPH